MCSDHFLTCYPWVVYNQALADVRSTGPGTICLYCTYRLPGAGWVLANVILFYSDRSLIFPFMNKAYFYMTLNTKCLGGPWHLLFFWAYSAQFLVTYLYFVFIFYLISSLSSLHVSCVNVMFSFYPLLSLYFSHQCLCSSMYLYFHFNDMVKDNTK